MQVTKLQKSNPFFYLLLGNKIIFEVTDAVYLQC